MATVLVEISDTAADRLERIARLSNMSTFALAERAIEHYVDTEEWQLGEIEAGLRDARQGYFISEADAVSEFRRFLD